MIDRAELDCIRLLIVSFCANDNILIRFEQCALRSGGPAGILVPAWIVRCGNAYSEILRCSQTCERTGNVNLTSVNGRPIQRIDDSTAWRCQPHQHKYHPTAIDERNYLM